MCLGCAESKSSRVLAGSVSSLFHDLQRSDEPAGQHLNSRRNSTSAVARSVSESDAVQGRDADTDLVKSLVARVVEQSHATVARPCETLAGY